MKAVTLVQQGIETELLMMKMIAIFSSLVLLGFVGKATANDIHFCDSCTQTQRGVLATQLTSGLGQVYIGDRTTGVPYLYTVNTVNGPVSVAPPGIQEQPVSQADADQFAIYSSVYRSYGNIGTLNVKIDLANGTVAPSSVSRMVEVASDESSAFASAFDVRREGATRQQVIQWLENDWQVPNTGENFIFFIQQVLSNAYKWRSSEDYSIRIDTTFNDKSRAIFAYDSAKRAIVYVEAYDSAGNLIGTSSSEPINVDYSSYESPGAASRPDYQRGIDWLTSSGAATISGGTVTVGSGTVLVGDVVQVK